MDRLLDELIGRGILDPTEGDFARAHQAEHGGALDTALLELDLVDEPSLLAALETRFERPVATPADFGRVDPQVGERLPESFAKSFLMCPLRLAGDELTALVKSPLPPEWVQELRELFGLTVRELVAPEHYVELASQQAWGRLPGERTLQLEARLARRRGAPALGAVVRSMASADSFAAATTEVLDFAGCLVELCCFLVPGDGELRVVTSGRGSRKDIRNVQLPEPGCTLHPAIVHGGYFLGPPAGNASDLEFYRALGRPLPHRAFIAPVPRQRGETMVLYADNGPRGIAARWVAELIVLAGRLGHKPAPATVSPGLAAADDAAVEVPLPTREEPARDAEEQAALDRLRAAAGEAGMQLLPFVEKLLAERGAAAEPDPAAALAGEVKGLFEKLATDIPAHLARGMEAAFRDLAPRLVAPAPPAPDAARSAAAGVEVVQKPAAPREVASYASRRQKSRRVKL